jgi:hypothetical protein
MLRPETAPTLKEASMRNLLLDLRYSLRQLVKLPGFALTAIVSLALGIGATTAVFSVVYAIVVDTYPYANSDRMVHMRLLAPGGGNRGFGLTGGQWQRVRQSPVVEDAFLTDGTWSLTITGSDVPEDVEADYVSSNTFSFMGVPAYAGRNLQPSDAVDGQDPNPVAELSYKFWTRHFNGDRSVIGKTIHLVDKAYTVVGIAAPRFTWDDAAERAAGDRICLVRSRRQGAGAAPAAVVGNRPERPPLEALAAACSAGGRRRGGHAGSQRLLAQLLQLCQQ